MKEFLEHDTFIQLLKNPFLGADRQWIGKLALHFIGEPVYLFLVADVFEFDTHVRSVAFLQVSKDVTKRSGTQTNQVAGEEILIEILVCEMEKGKVQVSSPILSLANGIGFRYEMALIAITQDHSIGIQFLLPVNAVNLYPFTHSWFCRCVAIGCLPRPYGEVETFKKLPEFGVHTGRVLDEILV